MKSLLFKTAWTLVKEMNYSLSDALKLVWSAYNNGVGVFVRTSYNGIKSISFGFVSKEFSIYKSTISQVVEAVNNWKPINQDGAEHYYGDGKFVGRKNALTNVSLLNNN